MTDKTEKDEVLRSALALAGVPVFLAGTIATFTLVAAWRAFVISKLYGWFLTPLGAPLLNWWHVWGLLLIYSAIVWSYKKPEPKSDSDKPWSRLLTVILAPVIFFAVALLLGWLIKTWGLS